MAVVSAAVIASNHSAEDLCPGVLYASNRRRTWIDRARDTHNFDCRCGSGFPIDAHRIDITDKTNTNLGAVDNFGVRVLRR